MASLSAKISQLVAARVHERVTLQLPLQTDDQLVKPQPGFGVPELPVDFDFGDTTFLNSSSDHLDFADFLGPPLLSETVCAVGKRKFSDQSSDWKRMKCEHSLDDIFSDVHTESSDVHTEFQLPGLVPASPGPQLVSDRAVSIDSDGRGTSPVSESCGSSDLGQPAEYHFEQIQRHAQLAVAALKRGQYERNRNVVAWAHDLKNKTANEVKKEAEQAWEADKDKERALAPKACPKKNAHGSTKRVEQFRKNMRRWMIGTQVHHIGVDWMVYARMEHLVAISNFILGDALPADPASPSAVAESICKYVGCNLPTELINGELAEPEPGKRYVIGPGLVPHLQAKQPRKVLTLAFTMPGDDDSAAVAAWVTQLKALFPKKPAPKSKADFKAW